jgi:hypothetical protein
MALSGPEHYVKASELLAEIEAVPTMPDATETALSVRAAAHAILAAAAAFALSGSGQDSQEWHKAAGVRLSQ